MIKVGGQKGYLAVEYLVSLSIMAVVIFALFALLHAACSLSNCAQIDADLHYSARSSMLMIENDVLAAKKLQVINAGKTLRLESSDGAVYYYIKNQQLYRHGKSKLPVAENAQSISFRVITSGLVEVIIQVDAKGRSYKLQSAFSIRSDG